MVNNLVSREKMIRAGWSVMVVFVVFTGTSILLVVPASAQGLIWSLPEDGKWVRYEGEYKQTEKGKFDDIEIRPNGVAGNVEVVKVENEKVRSLMWFRHLTLKSVGEEMADYNGTQVPCRWIEIKIVTGREVDGQLDPGPIGAQIYKVLVPEDREMGKLVDNKSIDPDGIPVSFIPIVKGYRKTGTEPPVELQAKVLQVYPTISLLRHYKTFQIDSDQSEDPQVEVGAETFVKYKGIYELESTVTHSVHKTELWRSDEIPFGLARWRVTIDRAKKINSESRTIFEQARAEGTVTTIEVDMIAREVGTDAKTELAVP